MSKILITDILPLDNKRRKVYINGKYAFPLYLSELKKYHIQPNESLDDLKWNTITGLIHRRIRERILYLLEAMPRTEYNIRKKLADNHYSEAYVNPVIEELKSFGYIDDRAYALNFAQSMSANRGMSRKAIIQKLYEKGVNREYIYEAVDTLPVDETELINKALKKKGLSMEEVRELSPKEKQKIFRYLVGKGFSSFSINMY